MSSNNKREQGIW